MNKGQKALVYRFLKPHREDFIPQLEPDVMSVIFLSILVCFFTFNHRFDHFSVLVFFEEFIDDLLVLIVCEHFCFL